MTISVRRLAALTPFFLSLATLDAQQERIVSRIDNSRMFVLNGRIPRQATSMNDRGAVESSFPMPGITLMLKRSAGQQTELQQLLTRQQDVSTPDYHQWLTPEQYADRFGVSANDAAKIKDWLESQGFTVQTVARSRTWITFSGTAEQVGSAFHTEIHRYSVNGKTHYANAAEPSIPAAFADIVAGFRGLHDFHPKPRLKRPARPEMTTSPNTHHLAPDDLATIYNIAPLYQAGVDGTGQSIVIVGQSAIQESDITAFRNNFNLSAPNLKQVLVPGQRSPGVVPGDVDEANLDIEWSGAVARNATIVFVYSNDVWQSAMYAVDQNLAPVLSMSYGGCEQADLVDLPAFQALAQQANAQGMTWFAATGDSGGADCEDQGASTAQNGLAVDIPAAIPEVTAMGGSEFNDQGGAYWSATNTANGASALSYIPEQAWNDTALGFGLAATGGGGSIFFPKPAWQTGPGVPQDSARHVPDLSMPASADHDGYYFFSSGSAGYVGGTSVAAPTMAGIFVLLNQYLVATGSQRQSGLGNINPMLYRLAQSTTGIFHDIATGDNVVPCAAGSPDCTGGSIGFNAGAGYDQVTGLGSVDAFNLVHQWSSSPPVNSAVVASIDSKPVFQQPQPDANGNSWTFKLTLNEEAGVGTTLTDFTIDGASLAAQIPSLFGSAVILPKGSISASYGFPSLAVPKNVVFGFTGVDAGGTQWTVQFAVPFNGAQIPLTIAGLGNAANGQQTFAPGMLISIAGSQLGNFVQTAATIPLPQYLAGFEASLNGVPAPLIYVSPTQVNLQIPYETQPGTATLVIGNPYENLTKQIQVTATAPAIFTASNGTVSPYNSGARGQTVTLFITGDGQVTPTLATGASPSAQTLVTQLPKPRLPLTVTVGGVQATVQFLGIPSGLVGVTQINYTIPDSVPPGVQPVVVTVGNTSSAPANFTVTQ
jgi:uncharacterized protein (TIGR03437 family)